MKCWGQSEGNGVIGNAATGSKALPTFVVDPAATTNALAFRVRQCTRWSVSAP